MKLQTSPKGSSSMTILWWLLSVATTLALSGGSLWLTSMEGQAKRLSERSETQGEKIGRIDTEQKLRWGETDRRLAQIEVKQDRLEQKIDKLLQVVPHVQRRLGSDD